MLITLLLFVRATYIWMLCFTHMPFVVNRTFNVTLTKIFHQQKYLSEKNSSVAVFERVDPEVSGSTVTSVSSGQRSIMVATQRWHWPSAPTDRWKWKQGEREIQELQGQPLSSNKHCTRLCQRWSQKSEPMAQKECRSYCELQKKQGENKVAIRK